MSYSTTYQIVARNATTGEKRTICYTTRHSGAGLRSALQKHWIDIKVLAGVGHDDIMSLEEQTGSFGPRGVYAGYGWEISFSGDTYHGVTGHPN